jgi:hypothetical protein
LKAQPYFVTMPLAMDELGASGLTIPRAMSRLHALVDRSAVVGAFMLLAAAMTWPLPLHLNTHLLGDPSGDTGVYIWNVWIFRHEILRHGHLPFSTAHIFGFTGGADFALHNYAPLAGLFGALLIAPLGLVGTFNVLMIAAIAASGCGAFALARRLGLSRPAAWAGGILFIAAPSLTARQTAHFSLVIAAPLPLFLWALLRTMDTLHKRDAMLVGLLCAMATYGDAYYGIYCALMGTVLLAYRFTRIETRHLTKHRKVRRAIDFAIALLSIAIAWRVLTGGTNVRIGALKIGMQTLYTPMLVVFVLLLARAWTTYRPALRVHDPENRLRPLLRLGSISVTTCLTLLTPLLIGIALRYWTNRLPGTEVYWRSSPRGVDLLAYLVPNPNHPLFGTVTRQWFLPDKADAFPEFIGSFSIVGALVIGRAARRRALPYEWVVFTGFFVWLSLGPFLYAGGVNTFIPGPWALLRYVPIVGMARSPSRFAIVAALGMSMLFAFAVQDWMRTRVASTSVHRLVIGLVAAALAFELVAVPRPLYSAAVPDVYKLIATTNEDSERLLELPTGLRDGTSSVGDFNASSEYFQTTHRRQLIGGYLSRISPWRRRENLQTPMLRALFALGEGRDLSPAWRHDAEASRDDFLARSCVRYVVINKRRATPALQTFAIEVLRLTGVHEDEDYQLLIPTNPPQCTADKSPKS